MFEDHRYLQSVIVTLKYVGFSVPLHLSVSLFVAMLLNRDMKFQAFYRSAFYLPSLLGGSVALAVLWRQVWGTSGIVNAGLALLGIDHDSWTGDPSTALLTLIVLRIWAFGATMVIFLAGLRQIPSEYYEAAQVDGANGFQRFKSITLPLLTPLIFFNLILDLVASLGAFTSAFILSNGTGGPADSTLFYTLYLYIQGFAQLNMGYASAMAWMLFLVLAIITGAIFWSAKYWVHYGDR
jgi:multiple sugar transport system permease protein